MTNRTTNDLMNSELNVYLSSRGIFVVASAFVSASAPWILITTDEREPSMARSLARASTGARK
jgi:hypothetical protein